MKNKNENEWLVCSFCTYMRYNFVGSITISLLVNFSHKMCLIFKNRFCVTSSFEMCQFTLNDI